MGSKTWLSAMLSTAERNVETYCSLRIDVPNANDKLAGIRWKSDDAHCGRSDSEMIPSKNIMPTM